MKDLKELTIGIVGGGTVGHATARTWVEHVKEVRVHDTDPRRSTHGLHDALSCDLVFVCLPEDAVDGFFHGCSSTTWNRRNYVLKSTVPIGTTRRLAKDYGLVNLIHSPEFLTERCAVTDAHTPSRIVIGTPGRSDGLVTRPVMQYLDACSKRFPGVPAYTLSSDESEAVKLITNAFFAVKVAFFNEAYTLCEKAGPLWRRIREAILADGRIAHSHTQVPGPDGMRGFGGRCLPKDLRNLIDCCLRAGFEPEVMMAAMTHAHGDVRKEAPDVDQF